MTRNYKSSYKYFLFFLLFNCIGSAFAYSDDFNAYFICHPHPEGINFGLAFEDGEVTQLGIDNFNFIVDYKERFKLLEKKNIKWLNLTLDLKSHNLILGKMENQLANCKRLENLELLLKSLKETLHQEMQKNTI